MFSVDCGGCGGKSCFFKVHAPASDEIAPLVTGACGFLGRCGSSRVISCLMRMCLLKLETCVQIETRKSTRKHSLQGRFLFSYTPCFCVLRSTTFLALPWPTAHPHLTERPNPIHFYHLTERWSRIHVNQTFASFDAGSTGKRGNTTKI